MQIFHVFESENFSNSPVHHIFVSENFKFPFFYKKYPNLGSEICKIKLLSQNCREFIRIASKIVLV